MFDNATTLWVIHISKGGDIPQRARDEGFVCIGWGKLGDLSNYDTRDKMKAAMAQTWPSWSPPKINANYGKLFRFAHVMQVGDPIVYPN